MNTQPDFQMTQPAAELEELLKELPDIAPARPRSILDEYSEFIAAALERDPPLSYDQLARVLNEKFKRDGKTDADGKPQTVTRQGINNFVLRRKAQRDKRHAEATAVQGGAPTPAPAPAAVRARAPAPAPKAAPAPAPAAGTFRRSSSLGSAPAPAPGTSAIDRLQSDTSKSLPGFVSGAGKLLKK